jgi:hypothetical protein
MQYHGNAQEDSQQSQEMWTEHCISYCIVSSFRSQLFRAIMTTTRDDAPGRPIQPWKKGHDCCMSVVENFSAAPLVLHGVRWSDFFFFLLSAAPFNVQSPELLRIFDFKQYIKQKDV